MPNKENIRVTTKELYIQIFSLLMLLAVLFANISLHLSSLP